jgi:hypothetical protein
LPLQNGIRAAEAAAQEWDRLRALQASQTSSAGLLVRKLRISQLFPVAPVVLRPWGEQADCPEHFSEIADERLLLAFMEAPAQLVAAYAGNAVTSSKSP